MTEHTKVGGYTEFMTPSEDSKNVLENVFEHLLNVDLFQTLQKEHLLNNHSYATQVVAGKNYKFTFLHDKSNYSIIVWRKLDGTYRVTSILVDL